MAVDLSENFIIPMGEMIKSRFSPCIKYFDLGKNFEDDSVFQGRMKIKYFCPSKRCQTRWLTTYGTVSIYYNIDKKECELQYLSLDPRLE